MVVNMIIWVAKGFVVLIQSNLSEAATLGKLKMWLLKAGGCLIQFKYRSLWILGQLSSGCLIQVGCLIEVTTNTGLTVFCLFLKV